MTISLRECIYADLIANGFAPSRLQIVKALVVSPGFLTTSLHRFAAAIFRRGRSGRMLGRMLWRINVTLSGCHIHMDACLGPGLFLPHPTGIVIGAGAKIGAKVTIYQNVTVGTTSEGYPVVLDGTVVYAGAVLVGGISIGPNATVGALTFVNRSFASGSVVVGSPARSVTQQRSANRP